MISEMRRLHDRGHDSRGVAVDRDGAMLGPDCLLVRRTEAGFRCLAPDEAAAIQAAILGPDSEPGWLFDQTRRIADALAKDEIALAQIHALRIPIADLDDATLRQLAQTARLVKTNFDPSQPRVPAGNPDGGQWTDAGGAADADDEDFGGYDDEEGWPGDDKPFGTEDYLPDAESSGASDRSPPPPGAGGDDPPPPMPSEPPARAGSRPRASGHRGNCKI